MTKKSSWTKGFSTKKVSFKPEATLVEEVILLNEKAHYRAPEKAPDVYHESNLSKFQNVITPRVENLAADDYEEREVFRDTEDFDEALDESLKSAFDNSNVQKNKAKIYGKTEVKMVFTPPAGAGFPMKRSKRSSDLLNDPKGEKSPSGIAELARFDELVVDCFPPPPVTKASANLSLVSPPKNDKLKG